MSHAEFLSWTAFYRHFPFDDVHRYHRPAALSAASHPGLQDANHTFKQRLQFLAPEPVPEGYSQAELNSFKAHGVKPPPRKV